MKKLTALFIFSFAFALANAQFKQIAEGPEFKEIDNGFCKIMQLKNGNTLFIHVSIKNGIGIKLYDARHKEKVVQQIELQSGRLKSGNVVGAFEINSNAVLIISEMENQTPVLSRLVIDGETGKLKEEVRIVELKKLTFGQNYDLYRNSASLPLFFVKKDPYSDYYALAIINTFASDANKRIEIIYYSPDHKEISRAYFSSPDNKYSHIRYVDMAVIDRQKVIVLANTEVKEKPNGLVIGTLEEGARSIVLDELDFSYGLPAPWGVAKYNPVLKKVMLLATIGSAQAKGEYNAYLIYFDPFTGKAEKPSVVYPGEANEKSLELFGKKAAYYGMPQNLFINSDGSFSIVYEEMRVAAGQYRADSYLRNLAIAFFDVNGKEFKNYLVPKSQFIGGEGLVPMYHSDAEERGQELHWGTQYSSFAYLNNDNKDYVLFNDVEENNEEELLKRKRVAQVMGVSECDGYYYELTGEDVFPERKTVFSNLSGNSEHELAMFTVSHYNKETKVLATVKLDIRRRGKALKVIWLQLQ